MSSTRAMPGQGPKSFNKTAVVEKAREEYWKSHGQGHNKQGDLAAWERREVIVRIKMWLHKRYIRKSKVLKRPTEITTAKNERKDCQPRQIDERMFAERCREESLWRYARQRREHRRSRGTRMMQESLTLMEHHFKHVSETRAWKRKLWALDLSI